MMTTHGYLWDQGAKADEVEQDYGVCVECGDETFGTRLAETFRCEDCMSHRPYDDEPEMTGPEIEEANQRTEAAMRERGDWDPAWDLSGEQCGELDRQAEQERRELAVSEFFDRCQEQS